MRKITVNLMLPLTNVVAKGFHASAVFINALNAIF